MPKLTVHFELTDPVNPESIATDVGKRLATLPSVETTDTKVNQYRAVGSPDEILAWITLSVAILHEGRVAVDELRKFLESLAALKKSGERILIELGLRKIPVDEVKQSETYLEQLARQLARR